MSAAEYRVFWGISVALLALLSAAFLPLLRRDPVARFLGLGMLLSLVPTCAVFPDDRLLVFTGIGATGLLARFLTLLLTREAAIAPPSRGTWPALGVGLALVHGVVAPIMLPARISGQRRIFSRMYATTPFDASLARQSLVIVNGPFPFFAAHLPLIQAVRGEPVPRYTRVLFPSFAAMDVKRTDAHTLRLRPAGGYLALPLDTVFRDAGRPMARGERVTLPDVTITVAELTPDGRPAAVSCRFREPLEHPSLRWLCWRDDRYGPFRPPMVGATLYLPAPRLGAVVR
jgi:hypothetical protein